MEHGALPACLSPEPELPLLGQDLGTHPEHQRDGGDMGRGRQDRQGESRAQGITWRGLERKRRNGRKRKKRRKRRKRMPIWVGWQMFSSVHGQHISTAAGKLGNLHCRWLSNSPQGFFVTWELGCGTRRENQLYSGGHPMGTACGLEPAHVRVEEAEKQGRGAKPLTFSWFKGVSRQKGGE